MRIPRILLVSLFAAISCKGSESSTSRHTLIDSRDTYDPRSLDPALSTDVPTGRAVGYVFDGPCASLQTRRWCPVSRARGTFPLTG